MRRHATAPCGNRLQPYLKTSLARVERGMLAIPDMVALNQNGELMHVHSLSMLTRLMQGEAQAKNKAKPRRAGLDCREPRTGDSQKGGQGEN